MSDLKDSISSILKHMEIDEVYHIDDYYIDDSQIDKNTVFAQFSSINPEIIQELFKKNTRTYQNEEIIDLETFKEIWDELNKDEITQIRSNIDNSFKWDNVASEVIDTLFDQNIKKITPSDWKNKKQEILDRLLTKKILFLFDNDWGIGETSVGIKEIKEILGAENISKEKVFCALYTHTVDPGDEYSKRKIFSDSLDIEIDRFLVISKKHEKESFVSLFRTTALIPTLHSFKDSLIDNMQLISEEIKNYFTDEIDILDLEYILLDVSENEGDFETETLYRLHKNIHYKKYNSKILLDDTINKTIKKMRTIKQISKKIKVLKPKKTFEIMNNELYDTQINMINCPIKSGDIFEFNNKQYILLAQPCDLMIRKNGERAYTKYRRFVNLLEISKQDKPNTSPGLKLLKYHKEDEKYYYINFTRALKIELNLLDLCTYNIEGILKIDLKEISIVHRLNSMVSRYNKLHTYFNNLFTLIKELHNKSTLDPKQKQVLERKILVADYSDFLLNLSVDVENKIIDFGLKRAMRVNKDIAHDALLNFMNFNSRLAHEVDLDYNEN